MVCGEWLCAEAGGDGVIAIIAALPREIAGLVRGVKPDAELQGRGVFLYRLPKAVVVAGGMGGSRVTLAVEASFSAGKIASLVSVGLAGGCSAAAAAGEVLEAGKVVDTQSGESYIGSGSAVLVTTPSIAGIREKARLHAAYGAAIVDMEAATVARLAEARGVGFRAIKGISDGHDFEMASLGKFSGKHGGFRTGAFALHTALRPHHWGKAMRLGRESQRALVGLEKVLRELM